MSRKTKTESFGGMVDMRHGTFAATSLEDARNAGRKVGKSLTSKKTMRMVFASMQAKKRKLDLSSAGDRLEAAFALKERARVMIMMGEADDEIWPILMGAKALESEQK
jgi:hypothetical protein